MTDAEWKARCELAARYRLVDHLDWTVLINAAVKYRACNWSLLRGRHASVHTRQARAGRTSPRGRTDMRIWNWIVGLFRRRNAQDEPPREPHLDERYTRDAVAASAARAAEAGINAKGPPPA